MHEHVDGGRMVKVSSLRERTDAAGAWHQVLKDVCHWCGCVYFIAEDDHDLVWEPGPERQKACSDELCECHTAAVIGERRD
jgi:hypothetical protein